MSTRPLDASIVVCTYNRARALGEMLASLALQPRPDDLTFEVLVASDGSTDTTALVAQRFQSSLPVRYLPGPHLGKSATLNRACHASRGDLLVFLDDDVVLARRWLSGMVEAARRRPDVSVFQGRILNRWDCPVPGWLDVEGPFQLKGVVVNGDFGAEDHPMAPVRFVGANAAVRRAAWREAGDFRTDIGPGHPTAGLNEDTDLALRLERLGHRCLYLASATVFHPVPAARLTRRYFRRWADAAGRSEARVFESYWTSARLLGMPRYVVRRYLEHRARQIAHFFRGDRRASFYYKVRSWQLAAALRESRSWRPE